MNPDILYSLMESGWTVIKSDIAGTGRPYRMLTRMDNYRGNLYMVRDEREALDLAVTAKMGGDISRYSLNRWFEEKINGISEG